MAKFRVTIEPVDDGATENTNSPQLGDGRYVTRPDGPRTWCVQLTDTQIETFQGYMVLAQAGSATTNTDAGMVTDGPS